ncbi:MULTISPECIES: alpha/beta hydrolase [unclassified Kitasatospora]|uniref:alpha/beta hydrolase n=1 Tax=unclassified Kitasatospora TaxID=2633591 RepID=UPI00340DC39F
MDIKTLYDADIINITIAKNAFDTLYSAFGRHIESWQHEVADRLTNSHWTGTASDHAQARIRFLGTELQSAHSELDLVGKALATAAEQFALAQSHLVYALDDAKAAKLNVTPEGTITWDKEPTSANYAGAGAETTAIAISNRITAALNEAAHADQELSARLNHFATNAGNGTGLDAATVAQDLAAQTGREQIPPAGTEPAGVKKWWDGLTDTEQQKFLHEHPDQIGNLDGVPAAVRDQANRVNLRNLIKDRETQLANLGPEPTRYLSVADMNGAPVENPDYTVWKRKHDALQEKLTGFQSIQKRLDGKFEGGGGPGSEPPLLLLGIGDQGQGRAILSWGDPDKARNVSSMVPGLNSNLAGAGNGDAMTAKRIYESAESSARANSETPSIASVFWLGYDAPQLDGPSVLLQDRAEEGGAAYNKFLTGLRATHEGAPAHMTAQGHSYGSLVVGKATQHPGGLPVDDIVLVGSPGVGVDKATQLGIGADHVYVGTAKYDPVADAPSPGMLIPGWAAVEAFTNPDGSWHGTDPASESFGGQRFSVADGTVTDSHDNYFGKDHKGGDSLPNIGKIVSGHGNTITREDPR